ncbi:MAG: excinuclease ABC subunit UvrC [Thermoplasmatota archaeon]
MPGPSSERPHREALIDLARIPEEPGVYMFRDADDVVLYVGKAGSLRARLSQYRTGDVEVRKQGMISAAARVEIVLARSEKEALLLEATLIKQHRPEYNVMLNDDKTYPYLRLSPGPWPRISTSRNLREKGTFFGPFPDAGAAKRTVALVREVFKLRNCKELIPGGCLAYQLDLCWAPCITDPAERERKAPRLALARADPTVAYPHAVDATRRLLRGDASALVGTLTKEMEVAADAEDFERAAKMRDRLRALTATLERQAVFSTGTEDRDAFVVARDSAGLALGVVVLIRNGQMVTQENYFFRRAPPETSDAELMAEFVARYYEHLPTVPPEVIASVLPAGVVALEAVLAEKRGKPVRIHQPTRGEASRTLELAMKNARFKLGQERLRRGEVEGGRELQLLAQALALAGPPRVIECFDISHLGGAEVVASMVALENARPAKSRYRRFKLSQDKNDDFAAMEEVVSRRFARAIKESEELPGLVLIDGGIGQLAAAKRALVDVGLDALPVASLAKREEEVFLPGKTRPTAMPEEARRVLMRARDEAHRFAVRYQRVRRAKALTKSGLDGVPGIGESRKRALLAAFENPERVAHATVEELSRVPGVGRALAKKIRAHFESG